VSRVPRSEGLLQSGVMSRELVEPAELGGILGVRVSGPPELVDAAIEALHLILLVADASRPYPNRRDAGVRLYVRATGVRREVRDRLARHRRDGGGGRPDAGGAGGGGGWWTRGGRRPRRP